MIELTLHSLLEFPLQLTFESIEQTFLDLIQNSSFKEVLSKYDLCYDNHTLSWNCTISQFLSEYGLNENYSDEDVKTSSETYLLFLKTDLATQILDRIQQFLQDSKVKVLKFSPKLCAKERAFVHALATHFSLGHRSDGKGENRYVLVEKLEQNKLPPKKSSKSKLRKEYKLPEGMSEIIDNFMFLGSGRDAIQVETLLNQQIYHILNCTIEWPITTHEKLFTRKLDLKDEESQLLFPHIFDQTTEYIHQLRNQGNRILVHCVVGKSRSASIVLAYLMRFEGMKLKEAMNHVKERRDIIKPNDSFIRQLMNYEKQVFGLEESTLEWVFEKSAHQLLKEQKEMEKSRKMQEEEAKLETIRNHIQSVLDEWFNTSKETIEGQLKDATQIGAILKQYSPLLVAQVEQLDLNFAKQDIYKVVTRETAILLKKLVDKSNL